jgi:hypothetical protein
MSRRIIPAIIRAAQEAELRESLGRLGRVDFALRTLTITGIAFAVEFLGDALLHLTQLPHVLYVVQRIILFGAFGTILLRGIDRRLTDAGLAQWFRYPAIAVWLLAVSLPAAWPSGWQIGLCLFLLLLVLGCSARGTPLPTEFDSASGPTAPEWNAYAPRKQFRPKWFYSPVSFLRSLLTLGCFWIPLIWLENASREGIGVWFARFGYGILGLVSFFVLIGRLNDAGRLPRKRYGFLLAGLVLLIGVFGRILGEGWFVRPRGFLFSTAALFAGSLEAWLRYVSGYEILALFLLIQVPLALSPSKPRPPVSAPESDSAGRRPRRRAPDVKINELALCEPFEFLRILLAIAFFWIPFIYMDYASGGGIGSWIARFGYLILAAFWTTFANGRFVDAGMGHGQYSSQYILVVATASLMPLAFRWVNGYGALAIFVLIQIPTAFLRSKPVREEPIPGDPSLNQSRAGAPHP